MLAKGATGCLLCANDYYVKLSLCFEYRYPYNIYMKRTSSIVYSFKAPSTQKPNIRF